MKVGDLVRNRLAVRTNPVVNDRRGWKPVPAGHTGVVIDVKQTNLNATWNKDGKGDVYVDVHLFTPDGHIRCGNYLASTFEVIG